MIEEPKFPGVTTIVIDTWKMRDRRAFHAPLIPDQFPRLIGNVAVGWGAFETIFENLLLAVLKADGTTNDNWRGLNFRKKRKLLVDKSKNVLAAYPFATADIESIMEDTPPIYQKRNLAVHGRMAARVQNIEKDGVRTTDVRLVCEGRYKGDEIRMEFTPDELDSLFYDIGELNGRLMQVSLGYPSALVPSPEILALRAFLQTNHPTYPNPSMLPSQPQPSGE